MLHWYVAEVALPSARRLERQLLRLGAIDIQVPVPGYVLWQGDATWEGQLRTISGVRLVSIVGQEEVQQMDSGKSRQAEVGVGATVSVPCGSMRVVGRVDAMKDGKATIVAALFGRPIKVTVPQTQVTVVELPEVWQ